MLLLGWFKNTLSSQTEKLMAAINFSDYLGLKHYKKANHLALAYQPQSIFLYNALDLNNQKILWLPSIFQFERKLGF